jgi:hypothetical protein
MLEVHRSITVRCRSVAFVSLLFAPALWAQQPAAATGPLAPEKFKDIQVLKTIQADQLSPTMHYFSAALGSECSACHQTDRATGAINFVADTNGKRTAREMIKMVEAVNAGDFGVKINCGTCHQGHERPAGLQPAAMLTSDEMLMSNLQQANAALRAMSPPPAGAGGGPGGPGGGGPGGRGQQPGPPAADVLKKYTDALGVATAPVEARVMLGTVTTRTAQAMAFSLTQKDQMYLQTLQASPAAQTLGFDGTAAWSKVGDKVGGLGANFSLDTALRVGDPGFAKALQDKYATFQSTRRTLALTPGSSPLDVNILRGTSGQITEQFYFDATTGLLLRHVTTTATPLNGALTETIDYANYRPEGGVLTPHKITRNNWNTLDTFTISRVTLNGTVNDTIFKKPQP